MIHSFFEKIITSVLGALMYMGGMLLGLIFVFLPTSTFQPKSQVPRIEKDLCLHIPKAYTIVEKYRDWFAFEEHTELSISFEESEMEQLEQEIQKTLCEQGTWSAENDGYRFVPAPDFVEKNGYIIEASASAKEKMLYYSFSDL